MRHPCSASSGRGACAFTAISTGTLARLGRSMNFGNSMSFAPYVTPSNSRRSCADQLITVVNGASAGGATNGNRLVTTG